MKKIISLSLLPLFFMSALIPKEYTGNDKTKIIELTSGYIVSRAIYVAAKIKVADFLVEGPRTVNELARKTDTNEDALYRLLRLLASYGIFTENKDLTFSLTPTAQELVSTNPDSLWAWITYHHEPNRWNAYADIEYTIKTGNPCFNNLFGKGYFDFISESPLLAQQFDEGMKNISADENSDIAQAYDFSRYPAIVDIGGGTGGLLAEITTFYPEVNALLFDLPHVQTSAETYLQHMNKDKNIIFIPAEGFFNPIPGRADLYILKRILHDWNDHDCLTILNNCRRVMHNNARLLIIEAIVSEENTRDIVKDIDMEMMILFGGKERTKKEWEALLSQADLKIVNIYPTHSLLSIIEVEKVTEDY